MIPARACLDAMFLVDAGYGPILCRFTGVAQRPDGPRLCFEGYSAEDAEDFTWEPPVGIIRSCRLVAHAR